MYLNEIGRCVQILKFPTLRNKSMPWLFLFAWVTTRLELCMILWKGYIICRKSLVRECSSRLRQLIEGFLHTTKSLRDKERTLILRTNFGWKVYKFWCDQALNEIVIFDREFILYSRRSKLIRQYSKIFLISLKKTVYFLTQRRSK